MPVSRKKCPPGVICFENITLVFIIIVTLVVAYLIYANFTKFTKINLSHTSQTPANITINNKVSDTKYEQSYGQGQGYAQNYGLFGYFSRPNNGVPGDVLLNPYTPPLRDERAYGLPGRIPINISTNIGAVDTNYRQVGILTPIHSTPESKNSPYSKILPLMGRPVNTSRDYWQYYSMSDQNNSVKLPLIRNGKSCTNEYGCPKIYNGDNIYVEGYNQGFKVTTYDSDTIKYIPYL